MINLQKCFIRIVSRGPFDAHANPIFVSLRILKFEDTIKLQISKVIYLNKKGLHPNSFNDMFLLNCDVHSYRSKNSIHFSYCRTNVRKFSLCFQGPKYFIPLALKFRLPLVLPCLILNLSHFFFGIRIL